MNPQSWSSRPRQIVGSVVTRSARLRTLLPMLLFSALSLISACDQSPTSPNSVLSSERRVGTLSGGGDICVALPITGVVNVTAKDDSLSAGPTTSWCQSRTDVLSFGLSAVGLSGTGRFSAGLIDGAFNADSATFELQVTALNGQTYRDSATGTPTFNRVSDSSCQSGERLEASVELKLQNLGPTVVSTRHCVPIL